MSVLGWIQGKGASGFGYNSTSEDVTEGRDLSGKTYLVTGCNSGLGLETVRVLALRGARVIGAARTMAKASAALAKLPGEHIPVVCELSDPASVRACVEAVVATGHPLDCIIANAGIMALPKRETVHGYERQFFTNHVGHFILVTGLVDHLTDDGRVVMLSSGGHRLSYPGGIRLDDLSASGGYSQWPAYGQSKLANLLFAKELATRLKQGQTANSVHPGAIATGLTRNLNPVVEMLWKSVGTAFASKTIPQGAATQLYVATHPDTAAANGLHWADCNLRKPSKHGQDAALASALWRKTEEIVAGLAVDDGQAFRD